MAVSQSVMTWYFHCSFLRHCNFIQKTPSLPFLLYMVVCSLFRQYIETTFRRVVDTMAWCKLRQKTFILDSGTTSSSSACSSQDLSWPTNSKYYARVMTPDIRVSCKSPRSLLFWSLRLFQRERIFKDEHSFNVVDKNYTERRKMTVKSRSTGNSTRRGPDKANECSAATLSKSWKVQHEKWWNFLLFFSTRSSIV